MHRATIAIAGALLTAAVARGAPPVTSPRRAAPPASSPVQAAPPASTRSRAVPPASVPVRAASPASTRSRAVPPASVPVRAAPPASTPSRGAPPARSAALVSHLEMTAVRVSEPPRVDGRLDDQAWRAAPVHRGFVQRTPNEGAAATEDTEVRIVYDDRALYVSFLARDRHASMITPRLGRRDSLPQSDWVSIAIDPYFDRKTAFLFQINSAGVMADASIADGAADDYAWDGVWDGEAAVNSDGWSAELRIPFATLRFPRGDKTRFGVHVRRFVNRVQETSEWHLISSNSTALVGEFETLSGLERVQPGLHLALLPYALAQVNASFAEGSLTPRHTLGGNGGFDLKYALTGQLTLDLAVNPDFGQVEVDPDVINLTVIETFYPEKRPFFTEGAEIFATPLMLLHTRRIGAPPPAPAAARDGGEVVSVDPLTRIYAATKLTGRVAKGTSVGLLSAVVGPSEAEEREPEGEIARYTASPLTHFGAVRLRQQLGGPSSVGALATMVQRAAPADALPSSPGADRYVGALDFDLRGAGPYSATGQLAASAGTCDEDRRAEGKRCVPLGGKLTAGRTGGEHLRSSFSGEFLAPDFSFNDAGYQRVRDSYFMAYRIGWRTPRPWWRTLATENTLYAYGSWNTAGYRSADGIGYTGYWKWRSQWETLYDVGIDFPRLDPYDTWYGRFPFHHTYAPWIFGQVKTNASLPLSGLLQGMVWEEAGTYESNAFANVIVLAGRRLQLQLGVGWQGLRNRYRCVDIVTAGGVEHYVFNRIDYDSLDVTLRVTATILRSLTAQFYGQLLHGAGRYPADGYRELTDPYTLAPLTIPFEGGADFTHTSLTTNLVLRWEYRPLSSVYLVWTHASSFDAGAVPGSFQAPGRFDLGDALADMGRVRPSDVVMLKASYLFQL